MDEKEIAELVGKAFSDLRINRASGYDTRFFCYREEDDNQIQFEVNNKILDSINVNGRLLELDYLKLNSYEEVQQGIEKVLEYLREDKNSQQEKLKQILKEVL
jgi:hypothetical protein